MKAILITATVATTIAASAVSAEEPEIIPINGGQLIVCSTYAATQTIHALVVNGQMQNVDGCWVSPINTWDLQPGQRYGVIGMGGLGHMAVKLAAAKGAEVIVFTTSEDKIEDAKAFGATEAYLWSDEEAMGALRGSFDLMLSTVPVAYQMQPFLNLLKLDGTLVNVGALGMLEGPSGMAMAFGRTRLAGSMTGGIAETQAVIDFAAKHGIAASYEMITPDQIGASCEKVASKQARYRYVIDMTAA